MFDLKRPCKTCPFRKGQGERFQLQRSRLDEIATGPAFQCHGTIDYSTFEEEGTWSSKKSGPQQCAGLMAVLHREGKPNQIMQVASRLIGFDPATLDPRQEAYDSLAQAISAHVGQRTTGVDHVIDFIQVSDRIISKDDQIKGDVNGS